MSMSLKHHQFEAPALTHGIAQGAGLAQSSRNSQAGGLAGQLLAGLARRRERRLNEIDLSRLSDHELADIGVSRDDIEAMREIRWRRRAR